MSTAGILKGERIVCFSTADWDTLLPTNKHHLMRRLAAGNKILYLETLGTRAANLGSGRDLSRIWRRLARVFQGTVRRGRNLQSISPLVLPSWGSPGICRLNKRLAAFQFRNVSRRWQGAIAWVYSPFAIHLLDQFRPRLVVYHMVDDLSAVPGADARAIREAEDALLIRADLVFCTEPSLLERARAINPAARLMPNVADYRHFSDPAPGAASRTCALLRSRPSPRLVFSGHLASHKVDLALLDRLAAANPSWSFILIGPTWEGDQRTTDEVARLRHHRNVTLMGHVPYKDLPAHLHAADVLLVPYRDTAATQAVFPLKFFEYLATGKPVVASEMQSLRPYSGVVRLATGEASWTTAIQDALRQAGEGAVQRHALARRQTWERRLLEMSEAIAEFPGRQPS